jgi:hypothetical protein
MDGEQRLGAQQTAGLQRQLTAVLQRLRAALDLGAADCAVGL